jgi:hypothetical protein
MRQTPFNVPVAGGVATRLPQQPANAGIAQNLTTDRETGGWSTRVGYEPFVVDPSNWNPFNSLGPVYGLHAAQELAGGARQHILLEADGTLWLCYDAAGAPLLLALQTGRTIPAPNEPGPSFTDTPYGTIVCNGHDRPVLVRPWPLGNAAESANSVADCIRPFGFSAVPTPPAPYRVAPMAPPPAASSRTAGAGSTSLWCVGSAQGTTDGMRWGLGFAANAGSDEASGALYGWAVSFISDTGSEGPISSIATTAWQLPAGAKGFRHAVAMRLPIGPPGTVARKLYRTNNFHEDNTAAAGDTTLYEAALIRNNIEELYIDAVRNADLGPQADVVPLGTLPSLRPRFGAVFAGRFWIDGGVDDPLSLYFSEVGLIEQFPSANYIGLSSAGGAVTGLHQHYAALLVFREAAIDVVAQLPDGTFAATSLSSSVGCRAPQTATTVPGLGVVFLGLDGIYALTGGLEGGAISELVNLTSSQDGILQRLTLDCMARSVAAWSPLTREWHCYLPADGQDRPTLGLVLHTERLEAAPQLSPWSTREGFPVGALCTLAGGTVVFGHHTGAQASGERGLFVLSATRALGGSIADQTFTPGAAPVSIYRSAWVDFGDAQVLKQVSYVTLWVLSTGKVSVTLRHYKDFSQTPVEERTYLAQPPDAAELPTYDAATLGLDRWRDERLVPLRFSTAVQSCAWFAFEVELQGDLVLVGWEYEYQQRGQRVIAGVRA